MKRLFLLTVLLVVFLVPVTSMARTSVFFNIGVGVPVAPVFVAPSPVFVAPAPVFVVPRPVIIQPAPVIVAPYGYVIKHHHRHHRHFEFEDD